MTKLSYIKYNRKTIHYESLKINIEKVQKTKPDRANYATKDVIIYKDRSSGKLWYLTKKRNVDKLFIYKVRYQSELFERI